MKSDFGVTVSIVNYRTPVDTEGCMTSVAAALKGIPYEILICDNSPVNEFGELPVGARITQHGANLGYGGGNNANLASASYPNFLILNPDVRVNRPAILACLELLNDPRVVAATPLLTDVSGNRQLSNRRFPGIQTELARVGGFDRKPNTAWSTLLDIEPNSGILFVDQPAGASILSKTETLRQIGGFDGRFAMYFEDVDLARRLSEIGRIVVDSGHAFVHAEEGTAKSFREATTFWIERNRVRFHAIHSRGPRRAILILLSCLGALSHGVAWAIKALISPQERRREYSARARGYFRSVGSWIARDEAHWRRRYLGLSA